MWIETAGDPVHCVLPVFKHYSDNTVFMPDSTVNPDLVNYYNQAALFGSFFMLLDPQFYREAGAAFGKKSKERKPIFLIGDHQTGWTYGTLFSVSPLGYELYMNNYIHWGGRQFDLYIKYGNPMRNNGMGLRWANAVQLPKIDLAVGVEAWDQAVYGKGGAAELEASMHIHPRFDLLLKYGYKSEGFVLGKQIAQGHNLGLGVSYRTSY